MTNPFEHLDPVRVENLIHHIERMAQGIDALTRGLGEVSQATDGVAKSAEDAGAKVTRSSTETVEVVERSWNRFFSDFREESDSMGDAIKVQYEFFNAITDRELMRAEKKWRMYFAEINRQATSTRGTLARLGGTYGLGLSGSRSVVSAGRSYVQRILGSLPMGGLLGVMLYGRMKELEWAAQAQSVGRTFRQVGDVGSSVYRTLTGQVAAFFKNFAGTAQELASVAASFTQFGVSADQAFQRIGIRTAGYGNTLAMVTFAADQFFKVSAGTSAKAVAEAWQASGRAIREVNEQMLVLGFSTRNTGTTYSQVMQMVTQSLGALRLQRETVADVGAAYTQLRTALANVFGGANEGYVSRMAQSGVTALAQGLQGMPEGYRGYIATGMFPEMNPLAAMTKLQEGMLDTGPGFMSQMVQQIGTILDQVVGQGADRYTRIGVLQKMLPQLGFEGSRAVVDILSQQQNSTGKQLRLTDKMRRELRDAIRGRESETSALMKVTNKILGNLAKVGVGLLNVTVDFYSNFWTILRGAWELAVGDESDPEYKKWVTLANRATQRQNKNMEQVLTGLSGVFRAVGSGLNATFSNSNPFAPPIEVYPSLQKPTSQVELRAIGQVSKASKAAAMRAVDEIMGRALRSAELDMRNQIKEAQEQYSGADLRRQITKIREDAQRKVLRRMMFNQSDYGPFRRLQVPGMIGSPAENIEIRLRLRTSTTGRDRLEVDVSPYQ